MGAAPSGSPGCPLFAFCTASTDRKRTVLIANWSSSAALGVFSSVVVTNSSWATTGPRVVPSHIRCHGSRRRRKEREGSPGAAKTCRRCRSCHGGLSMANEAPFAPLPRSFYARPAEVVAKDALGKILVFEREAVTLAGRIVEAEAYLGIRDRAAHSFGGRRTARNEVMWGPPGFAYVFFVYGMHFHLNLVTDAEGLPCAVLLLSL